MKSYLSITELLIVDSNDGQNVKKIVVNNEVIEERESPLPDINQVKEVCDLNDSDSDWSDDSPEQ